MVTIRNKDTGEMYCFDIPMFNTDKLKEMLDEQWEIVDKNV